MQVRDSLTQRASEFNIMVDDVAITHLSFGTEARHPCLCPQSGSVRCTLTLTVTVDGDAKPHQHAEAIGCSVLQFTKAVESKQVAQQDAERARFVVMKADQVRNLCGADFAPGGCCVISKGM